ncbi:MAG: hypothetical protein KC518_02965 [Candidatus Cloacimonetes bacterium]|nr:hypothetical protein [Candidatus Cloacimonadota bacterium]
MLLATAAPTLAATEKFFNYYEKGQTLASSGDWPRALEEFRSAASLEFEDVKRKRTYGTRFISYHPHLQLGICLYQLGDLEEARKELLLHKAYLPKSDEADALLRKIDKGESPEVRTQAAPAVEPEIEDAAVPPVDIVTTIPEASLANSGMLDTGSASVPSTGVLEPPALLTIPELPANPDVSYSPNAILQVGSRLSIAVLPFEVTGVSGFSGEHLAEALTSELVNLRRFRVIERTALDKIMQEQALGMSGMVDQAEAVELAKLVGADALVMGSVVRGEGGSSLNVRVIDTETGVALAAHKLGLRKESLRTIDKELNRLAVAVYNDLPLLSGNVVSAEGDEVYLDIGGVAGVRKGFKLVAYRQGQPILHPTTGVELGVRVTQLGELIVIQVQDQMVITKPIGDPELEIQTGDKVITK